jgi:hypothetical protein
MSSKIDQSLIEVWEMKDRVYNDFKKSKFDNFIDFLESEMVDIRKNYNIKYRSDIEKAKQQAAV